MIMHGYASKDNARRSCVLRYGINTTLERVEES
jgi:hypothetical protein